MSTGQIIVCEMEYIGGEYKLHFFNPDGTITGHDPRSLCQHGVDFKNPYNILSIIIGNTEYIAVSCSECKIICLTNPDDLRQNPVVVYRETHEAIGRMCLGPTGTLCALSKTTGRVSLLDCTSTKFSLKKRLCKIENMWPDDICFSEDHDICYIEHHDLIVLSVWTGNRICAVRSSDGQTVWNIVGKCRSHGLVILPDPGLLLVEVKYSNNIMILSPNTGDILQTIPLPVATRYIYDLHLLNNKLLVHHEEGLSCCSVSAIHD